MYVNLKDYQAFAEEFITDLNCNELLVAFGLERYFAGGNFGMSSF
jgi:hypothetical protein